MGCQTLNLNPQILYKTIHGNSKPILKTSSFSSVNDQQLASTTIIPKTQAYNVKFKTLGACKLGISRYPDFDYDASGGSGSGKAMPADPEARVFIDFDIKQLYIPPLSTATTKFLGLPLPPFLRIDIVPEAFRGEINPKSGEVDLKLVAKFCFSVGSLYKARPLLVETVLTTEESRGEMRGGRGERLDENGTCKLVGVATIEPIHDVFMDTFLSLPTECLAILNAAISFSSI